MEYRKIVGAVLAVMLAASVQLPVWAAEAADPGTVVVSNRPSRVSSIQQIKQAQKSQQEPKTQKAKPEQKSQQVQKDRQSKQEQQPPKLQQARPVKAELEKALEQRQVRTEAAKIENKADQERLSKEQRKALERARKAEEKAAKEQRKAQERARKQAEKAAKEQAKAAERARKAEEKARKEALRAAKDKEKQQAKAGKNKGKAAVTASTVKEQKQPAIPLAYFNNMPLPGDYKTISIYGQPVATKAQAIAHIKQVNPAPKLSCSVEEIVELYWQEASREGVRPDLALAQALVETGYFRYGGSVVPEQNNFCGLGTTGSGVRGASFATPQLGVRAQIQHLLAYSHQQTPKTEIVDPRYDLAHNLRRERGWVDTWYGLNGTWAMGANYCEKIMVIYQRMLDI